MKPACNVCGAPATSCANDLIEGEPGADSEGRLWATWEKREETKFGCDEHIPESMKHLRSGSVVSRLSGEIFHAPFLACSLAAQGLEVPWVLLGMKKPIGWPE